MTDNGSEFKAEFTKIVLDDGAVRWLTYPKYPKMNAHAERFNRTIQEEFIEFHKDLLFEDLQAFNDKLLDYLIWFNESRPHYALGLRSPMQFLAEEHQCNMYWRDTPMQAMKQWHQSYPELFNKRPYDRPGCDSYTHSHGKARQKMPFL